MGRRLRVLVPSTCSHVQEYMEGRWGKLLVFVTTSQELFVHVQVHYFLVRSTELLLFQGQRTAWFLLPRCPQSFGGVFIRGVEKEKAVH